MSERAKIKRTIRLNSITHSIRAAQTVLQYGVGAMIDFPDQTLMTASPEYWKDPDYSADAVVHIHDERLENLLNVDYFGMPKDKDEYKSGISYVRFPKWYFCPKCRRFQSLDKWTSEFIIIPRNRNTNLDMRKPFCTECRVDLVPARIVVACEQGHINDFPWIEWTHEKSFGGRQDICSKPDLTFSTGATASAGLEGLVLKCSCGAKTTLAKSFEQDSLKKFYSCTGFMPWKNQREACVNIPQVLQRGASKVYFPKVVSSLVIPPYSDKVNKLINNSIKFNTIIALLAELDGEEKELMIRSKIERWVADIANEISIDLTITKNIITRKLLPENVLGLTETTSDIIYRIEEYEALTGKLPGYGFDEYDFVREEMDIASYNIPGINKVILIHKIREVRALTGFTRLNPPDSHSVDVGDNFNSFTMSTKEPETRWYPGYEVRGEGIFLNFDEDFIKEWIDNNRGLTDRVEKLNKNYSLTYMSKYSKRCISPKFLLLHTMAHLLIRQLSFECGYTTASLKERIYCDTGIEDVKMAGIFIYTASGDSEGTLGGLVRQGHCDNLHQTIKKALTGAQLCSNDPVCIESNGQGREAMNLAACHSCLLLPETSCEEYNVFLDRASVVGTLKAPYLGFYSKWLEKF